MARPGIHKSLEAMQALCVSVIFAEHSFRDSPRNTQCSNATAIDSIRGGWTRLTFSNQNGSKWLGSHYCIWSKKHV